MDTGILLAILGIMSLIELVAIIETWYWVMKLKTKILGKKIVK